MSEPGSDKDLATILLKYHEKGPLKAQKEALFAELDEKGFPVRRNRITKKPRANTYLELLEKGRKGDCDKVLDSLQQVLNKRLRRLRFGEALRGQSQGRKRQVIAQGKRGRPKRDDDDLKKVQKLLELGFPLREIERKTGVSRRTIGRAVKNKNSAPENSPS